MGEWWEDLLGHCDVRVESSRLKWWGCVVKVIAEIVESSRLWYLELENLIELLLAW